MLHIYQMLYHKINVFRNHSYCHEYDGVIYLSLFIRVYLDLSEQVHDVIVDGE